MRKGTEDKKLGAVSPYGESTRSFSTTVSTGELVDTTVRRRSRPESPIHDYPRQGDDYFPFRRRLLLLFVVSGKRNCICYRNNISAGNTGGRPEFSRHGSIHWQDRERRQIPDGGIITPLTRPGRYVLCMESDYTGVPFTCFRPFKDMINWTFMDTEKGYPLDRYCGGP